MPTTGWTRTNPEPAYELITPLELDAVPGVTELEQAAHLFKVPLRDVARAAEHVTPWTHVTGYPVWSTRQLARWIVQHPARKSSPRPGARKLTPEQVEAAAIRAREIGIVPVAEELGVSRSTLIACWRRYGVQGPGRAHASVIRDKRRRERISA
jgi:hypothetical protein